jgi:hypothetical protein
LHRPSRKQLSIVFSLILGVTGATGGVCVMSSQDSNLLGLIESVGYLMTASGRPSQGAKSAFQTLVASSINRPFLQNLTYPGCIKPNHITQIDINNSIKSYYDYWKNTDIRKSNGVTPGGGYYTYTQGTGGTGSEITTSEANGYSMVIFALMAGYDRTSETRDVLTGVAIRAEAPWNGGHTWA